MYETRMKIYYVHSYKLYMWHFINKLEKNNKIYMYFFVILPS